MRRPQPPGEEEMELMIRAVVHPWLCDMMGHLTTRHYVGMFDDAAYALFAQATGWNADDPAFAGMGWADVRHEIEYKDEVPAGALVEIFGTITRVGNSSLETRYEMRRASTGAVAATILAKTVFFDLKQRKASPLTEAMRQGIERFLG
jgi:acyl-CoA thioester hydrolase